MISLVSKNSRLAQRFQVSVRRILKFFSQLLFGAFCSASFGAPGFAQSLVDFYSLALANDPQTRAAGYRHEATLEQVDQARARLLPQLSFNSSRREVTEDREDGSRVYPQRTYRSENDGLSLRQPILQPRLWSGLNQARASVQASANTFEHEGLALSERLVRLYLNLLLAREKLLLNQMQTKNAETQLVAAQRLQSAGIGTRTEVLEVQAQRDRVVAEELRLRGDLKARARELELAIGAPLPQTSTLRALGSFAPTVLVEGSLDTWMARALEGSLQLRARDSEVKAAKFANLSAFQDHLPSLDLSAQVARSASEESLLVGVETKTSSIGLSLSIPLYQGGAISSRERQTSALLNEAQARLDLERNSITLEVTRAYDSVAEGVVTIAALEQAVASGEQALLANQKSFSAGVRRSLDVLAAEQRLSQVRLELIEGRMQALMAWVRLNVLSGRHPLETLKFVDSLLAEVK
jgi:TolC family type I secretion outer membrane protein